MVCVCSEEGRADAEALRTDVMERLSLGSEELEARPVTADTFLTAVVQSLNWDFDAHITSIDNDQWSAVTAEKYDRSVGYYVHCDRVEDGVAAVWNAFAIAKWETDGIRVP
jgi:hypothetical protein